MHISGLDGSFFFELCGSPGQAPARFVILSKIALTVNTSGCSIREFKFSIDLL